jgi:antitoxin CptB
MAPSKAAGEDISIRRRRLQYRAAHRGTRELDLLLAPFAAAALGEMDERELGGFEQLLDETENDLQSWLLGQAPPPAVFAALIKRIIAHKQTTLNT